MSVNHVPEGYHTITPYLVVENADELIEFIKNVFDGQLLFKMENEAGKISHAEIKIGDSHLMLADASDEWQATSTLLHLYVENADSVYEKAISAGAISVKELQDQIYGDRSAAVKDSFGNIWGIATHFEDVSEEEMRRRMNTENSSAESSETRASAG